MHNNLTDNLKNSTATNLRAVEREVEMAAVSAGRLKTDITIVGVTKVQPAWVAAAGALAGLKNFGENRVQEAGEKIPLVKKILELESIDFSLIRWHLIGPLQSNKAAKAARLFDVIQSIETIKVAEKVSSSAVAEGRRIEVFVEVNTTNEAQKAGVHPNDARDFAIAIKSLPGLFLQGLMTVGPFTDDVSEIRRSFQMLKALRDEIATDIPPTEFGGGLSMGMSGDYAVAISEGATVIRPGTAIFGHRPIKHTDQVA